MGKDLVDKITSSKALKHNEWTKEANVDKLVTQNIQRTNELENPLIDHTKANNRSLKLYQN